MQLYPHPHCGIITGGGGGVVITGQSQKKTKLNENNCRDILSGLSHYKETFRNICFNTV